MKKPARGAGAAAFLLPFGLVVAGFALAGVYPFGPFYAFIVDMQQQYFPFLTWFQREMAGGLSSWTWSIGLGTSVVPLYAYYLASPLNFLLLLVPSAFLSEAVTVLIAVKIGLAGWFAWLALRKMTGLSGVEALIFSGLYALCGFAIGYQANIIWLDTFALLPLLCMATLRLLKDKRWGWYPLLLALCIWCNYYLGFMVCIFVVLVFVAAGIAQKISLREWGRRLARLLLASLTGVAMTAVILLPSILALAQNGSLSAETWESFILYNPIDVLGNFALLSKPTLLEGLPNVFVGVLGMMLAILYLSTKAIPLRERLAVSGVALLLLASFILAPLDFLWNALHTARDLPARYSFLLSFVLLWMGARALSKAERPTPVQLGAMAAAGILVAVCALLGPQGWLPAVATLCAVLVYAALFALYGSGKLLRRGLALALVVLVCVETGAGLFVSVRLQQTDEYLVLREDYPAMAASTQALLERAQAEGTLDAAPRVETSEDARSFNSPALLGYRGASSFSSLINTNVGAFFEKIGLPGSVKSIRYGYQESSPFSTALLGIGAFVARDGYMADRLQYWTLAGVEWAASLYQNQYPLSLGFAVQEDILRFEGSAGNPLASQNELFTLATGVQEPLFTEVTGLTPIYAGVALTETASGHYTFAREEGREDTGTLRWEIDAPVEGLYYLYMASEEIDYMTYGMGLMEYERRLDMPYLRCIGAYEAGDPLFFEGQLAGDASTGEVQLQLGYIHPEAFEAGYAILAANQMTVTTMEGPLVEGSITMQEPGLLYTSIPYEAGWTAYIDGVQTDTVAIGDAMLGIPVPTGQSALRFEFKTPGLLPGICITGVAIAAYVAILLWQRKQKRAS